MGREFRNYWRKHGSCLQEEMEEEIKERLVSRGGGCTGCKLPATIERGGRSLSYGTGAALYTQNGLGKSRESHVDFCLMEIVT